MIPQISNRIKQAYVIKIGDFESFDDAIHQACLDLNCQALHKGVISKGQNKGGFMIVTTQDLEAL